MTNGPGRPVAFRCSVWELNIPWQYVAVWQLDADGAAITANSVTITSTGNGAVSHVTGTLNPRATALRCQIHLHSTPTVRFDDLTLTIS